jgi:hypothetical protein
MDEYGEHRSLWDEFRCYREIGPIEELEWAWRQDIERFIKGILAKIPSHQAMLLSVFAADEHGRDDRPSADTIASEEICAIIWSRLDDEARYGA